MKHMPAELEKVYQALWKQLVWLHAKWNIFGQLYANKDAVDLLNESAPTFFAICQDIFVDDIIISISRLTDPAKTKNKDNLTLEQLVNAIDLTNFSELRDEINKSLKLIKTNCAFARDNRNKRIAHADLQTHLHVDTTPLPTITKNKIDEALTTMSDIMNKVQIHFNDSDTGYENPILPDDENHLLRCLREAKDYRKQHSRHTRTKKIMRLQAKKIVTIQNLVSASFRF